MEIHSAVSKRVAASRWMQALPVSIHRHKNQIMKDYRRLKADENSRLSLNWNLNREIDKLNYRIHTDAIKNNLIS